MNQTHESNIICPYCGYEDTDSWEWNENYEYYDCPDCGEEFRVERYVEVTYSTFKKECKDGTHDYQFESKFISKRDYKNRIWEDLKEEDWQYYINKKCTICEDEILVKIPKELYEEME